MSVRFSIQKCLIAALLYLVAPQILAQHATAPWDESAFNATPQAIQTAAAAVAHEQDANVTVLLEENRFAFDSTGRMTETRHWVYRVDTPAGVNGWSAVGSQWQPWFQSQPQVRARVIDAQGNVYTLDPKTLSDSPANPSDQDTFADDRLYQAPLPGVAPGAIVEEIVTIQDNRPFFDSGVVYRIRFGIPNVPVVESRLIVEAPDTLPLRYKTHLLPDTTAEKEEKDHIVRLTFAQDKMKAADEPVANLPADVPSNPQVEFSTGASWQGVADGYAKLAEPAIRPLEVAKLTTAGQGGNRDQTIAQILTVLHKNVRYTGIEFGQSKLTPQPPVETLRRHYGDCKDKATLLVSMLRAVKIPAYLALLATGPGQDINPDLPGMSLFNHAIVYVPASPGSTSDLWIDATDQYAPVGELPGPDRGRHALVIGDPNTYLITTPAATSRDNLLVEDREFTLPENGPAHVVERSESHGDIDQIYRAVYGGTVTKAERKELERYAKNIYLADSLTKIDHSDGLDIATPFQLTLTMDKANRGVSTLDNAEVAIHLGGLYSRLPAWFFNDPDDTAHDSNDATHKPEKPRTEDFALQPFVTKWRYHIVVPQGFKLREVPADVSQQMGPAILTQHYEKASDGNVAAVLTFDAVKGRYTPPEASALRKAIYERRKAEATVIYFDEIGASQLAAGKIGDAIKTYQGLIAAHPAKALPHVQMSKALRLGGVGDKSRLEAEEAVRLEPKSALAYRTLGASYQSNSIGQDFGKGFDLARAIAAYTKAVELDPDDIPTRVTLGFLYEHDRYGMRYSANSDLTQAIRVYREAQSRDKETFTANDESYILYALWYAHQYGPLLKELATVPPSSDNNAFRIAAATAESGVEAGLAQGNKIDGDATLRNAAFANAGQHLMFARLYKEAAEILAQGVTTAQDSAAVSQQIDRLRLLHPYDAATLPASDPRTAVSRLLFAIRDDSLTDDQIISTCLSRYATATPELAKFTKRQLALERFQARSLAEGVGPSLIVAQDELSTLKFVVEGDDSTGYKITVQSPSASPMVAFVVLQQGAYKMLAITPGAAVAGVAYDMLKQGNLKAARQWLDWARETNHAFAGGDDPLYAPVFPRFWTVGQQATPEQVGIAIVAANRANQQAVERYLPAILQARKQASDKTETSSLDLLLASIYNVQKKWPELTEVSRSLLKSNPDSATAMQWVAIADMHTQDWANWQQVAKARLQRIPNDPDSLRSLSRQALAVSDYARAQSYLKQVQDLGKANGNDLNTYAWISLFTGNVDQAAIDAARQSVTLTESAGGVLHTLACLYAEKGKTTEARQLLLKAMLADREDEPDENMWYGFGRIYEQYGQYDAAVAAYRKLQKPDNAVDTVSTWQLAQKRLQVISHLSHPAASLSAHAGLPN